MEQLIIDAAKNLENVKKAADKAVMQYGFRLCNADNAIIDTQAGVLYVNCKLVYKL